MAAGSMIVTATIIGVKAVTVAVPCYLYLPPHLFSTYPLSGV